MPTRLSDLWNYDDAMPDAWQAILDEIQLAGADRNRVESLKLKMQVALLTTQANVDLFINDETGKRAASELEAATARAKASEKIAKSLRLATWVLAGATIVLVLATAALVFVSL